MGEACVADLHYMFSARTMAIAVAAGGSEDAETERQEGIECQHYG